MNLTYCFNYAKITLKQFCKLYFGLADSNKKKETGSTTGLNCLLRWDQTTKILANYLVTWLWPINSKRQAQLLLLLLVCIFHPVSLTTCYCY